MTQDKEAQARSIGRYEDSAGIPFGSRITWPYYAIGVYVFKPGVRPEQIQERLETIQKNKKGGIRMKRNKTTEGPTPASQKETYKYYALRGPLDNFNYPRLGCDPPLRMRNYAWYVFVEDGRFRAWGEIEYPTPLDEGEMEAYSLAPSKDNPDMRHKIKEQAEELGELEDEVPLSQRLTWYDFSSREFQLHERVTPEQLEARLEYLRNAENP